MSALDNHESELFAIRLRRGTRREFFYQVEFLDELGIARELNVDGATLLDPQAFQVEAARFAGALFRSQAAEVDAAMSRKLWIDHVEHVLAKTKKEKSPTGHHSRRAT